MDNPLLLRLLLLFLTRGGRTGDEVSSDALKSNTIKKKSKRYRWTLMDTPSSRPRFILRYRIPGKQKQKFQVRREGRKGCSVGSGCKMSM